MWVLTRFAEFNKAYHSADATWDPNDSSNLRLPQGLLFSLVLVTPFWTVVGLGLHLLTK